jgi:rRNA maturation RNase YbeY
MRALNAFYRKRPRATDILSFRAADPPPASLPTTRGVASAPLAPTSSAVFLPADPFDTGADANPTQPRADLGDMFIAADYCARCAAAHGWPLAAYLPLVAAHGIAHLAGYTHDSPEEYARMKGAETAALAVLRGGGGTLARSVPESYLP